MADRKPIKKRHAVVPGTLVKCESGRYIAYYEHRTDIVASGENEKDAKKNLKKLYELVMEHEDEEEEKKSLKLPAKFETKKFTDKLDRI